MLLISCIDNIRVDHLLFLEGSEAEGCTDSLVIRTVDSWYLGMIWKTVIFLIENTNFSLVSRHIFFSFQSISAKHI